MRRELGVRTIFNALGPLANPAGATRQLIGVGRPELVTLLARRAGRARHASGRSSSTPSNGLDELVPGVGRRGHRGRGTAGRGRGGSMRPGCAQAPVALEELAGGDAGGERGDARAPARGRAGPPPGGGAAERGAWRSSSRAGPRQSRRGLRARARVDRRAARRPRCFQRLEGGRRARHERTSWSRSSRTSRRASRAASSRRTAAAPRPTRRGPRSSASLREPGIADHRRDQGALAVGGRDPAQRRRKGRELRALLPARPRGGDLGRDRTGPLRRRSRTGCRAPRRSRACRCS